MEIENQKLETNCRCKTFAQVAVCPCKNYCMQREYLNRPPELDEFEKAGLFFSKEEKETIIKWCEKKRLNLISMIDIIKYVQPEAKDVEEFIELIS